MIRSRIDSPLYVNESESLAGSSDTIKRAFAQLSSGAAALSLPRPALYSILAVSGVESAYGAATSPPEWSGSNNWGAIQCAHGPPCGDDCFSTRDTHADGTSYEWCFAKYPTPEAGALALARLLVKRVGIEVLSTAEPVTVARAMKNARYFEAPLERYTTALGARMRDVVATLGPSGAVAFQGASAGGLGILFAGAVLWLLSKRIRDSR